MAYQHPHNKADMGEIYVFSTKPPGQARAFNLRGGDLEAIAVPRDEGDPVGPDQYGIKDPTASGLCKYCQLMLHPDPPRAILHQPNLQSLLLSTACEVCKWLEIALLRGSSKLADRYSQGDPALCDVKSTSERVTVSILKRPTYTLMTPIVGDRSKRPLTGPPDIFVQQGKPLLSSTAARLGKLFEGLFWRSDSGIPGERLNLLKTWLSECADHPYCSALGQKGDGISPSRIIDLTGSVDSPQDFDDIKVKLRNTSEETSRYVALSYCWGADPEHHFVTTEATLKEHEAGIDYGQLPLVHREAILATLRLGIRYLWIDSICIIQDSVKDWETEAAKMGSVYSNATLTLAATSSKGPEDGLLHPFQGALHVDVHGEDVMVRFHTEVDVDSDILNTRGWTLQESFLSPRTVCFGDEQWMWKCASRVATEDGLLDDTSQEIKRVDQWARIVRQGPGDDGKNYLRQWYKLVENYTERTLTYDGDKVKAIAGLADLFAGRMGYRYLAGLWVDDLPAGLMWNVSYQGVVQIPDAIPSWSWISVKGKVLFSNFGESCHSELEIGDYVQDWSGKPLSSTLANVRLHVRGRLMQAKLGEEPLHQVRRYGIFSTPGAELIGEAFLDQSPEPSISAVYCLLTFSESQDKGVQYWVLIIVPVSGSGGYRRIGIGMLQNPDAYSAGVNMEAWKEIASAPCTDLVLV